MPNLTQQIITNQKFNKMKKSTLFLMILATSIFVKAEEKNKQKEVGLAFSSLNDFGLTFKIGTNKSLWRFNTLLISGRNFDEKSDSLKSKQRNIGLTVLFGREYRFNIIEKLEFRIGADVAFRYQKSKYDYDDKSVTDYDRFSERITYEPGINLVLGLNYIVKEKLVIGAEILPHFRYITGKSEDRSYYGNDYEVKTDISGFTYGLSNNSAQVSLSYRF